MTSLSEDWESLTQPYLTFFSSSQPFELVSNKVHQLHGQLQTNVCTYLNPKSADVCMNLIRALPISLATQFLPMSVTTAAVASLAVYAWFKSPDAENEQSTTTLLNAVATAFFINAIGDLTHGLTSLVNIPLNLSISGAYFYLASRLEIEKK